MLKVMIVEDNVRFRELLRGELLSKYPSMEVVEAGSGEEALRRLGPYPFDLVFMDIGLPGENGLEITRKTKTDRQDITAIILTSYNLPEYRRAAFTCGANCFISKDSLKWEDISTVAKCHQEAKQNGRKPTSIRLGSG